MDILVVSNGKPVGFVPDTLEQVQNVRIAVQKKRVFSTGQVDFLVQPFSFFPDVRFALLCNGRNRERPGSPDLIQQPHYPVQLTLSAVDQQQVGLVVEAFALRG